jgi:hypothetical protein
MPGSATLTETAELLRQAAQLIRAAGYKPWAPAGSEPGYSLSTALCTVTGCDPSGRHNPACLALHTRLAGYLYLSGRTTAAGDYLPAVVAIWEEYDPPRGRPSGGEVIAILEHAAAITGELALSRS